MSPNKELSEKAKSIYKGLKEKSFGIKDIKKIDPNNVRQLRYWISLGMVGGSKQRKTSSGNGGWEKFNFYEFVWILIIRELKELNFDNLIISKCANEVFSRKDSRHKMLEFEKAVLFALTNRKDVFFVVNKHGEFDVSRPEDMINISEKRKVATYVVLNLLPLIKDFLCLKDFFVYITDMNLLRENETKALEFLHKDANTQIKVSIEDKGIIVISGETGVRDFIESIFTHDYKAISIQL